ncbi:hypothetical protein [Acidipila sp. EB88]|uniref:hypothetical protein n=1 Tax=Acidipila sp. EB88 TaxID=2305226 RepID=UPI000F5F1B0B|nr:hypothetical protein [Acidipila sp. EB88]RRA48362.1 hypothetical protein D1Y84_08745 [Acidipila sp. EB88]
MHGLDSPFIVPLGAFAVAIVAIIAGAAGKIRNQQLRADQRVAMLAHGIPLAEIERVLGTAQGETQQPPTPWNAARSAAMIRRTAIILIASGLGIVAFFVALVAILHDSEVYSGAAVGLIPFAIGVGFLFDYHMQKRDMSRLQEESERSIS